jgi:hypothetical protein
MKLITNRKDRSNFNFYMLFSIYIYFLLYTTIYTTIVTQTEFARSANKI